MSTVSYILPLKAPTPLPATGVDSVTFKVWKNTLRAHLEQDANHHFFLPGGRYASWQAAEIGQRIQHLLDDDPDKVINDGKLERIGVQAHQAELDRILILRNSQLSKFITHIATLCHHTENDDITNCSTSLDWILDYLCKHYGLTTKGANFLNIAEHVYKQGTPYQTFYKQFRAAFVDNLRKTGDRIQYKNNQIMLEDEKLSPSFENAIVLWTLDKIDPRLPARVKKNYGYQITGNTTLKDVQPVIFENIDAMLEELDQAQTSKAFALQSLNDETSLNAVRYQTRNSFRGARSSSFRGRGGNRGRMRSSNQTRPSSTRNAGITDKFCRICNLAGSDARIYTSHEIGNCSRLTIRDLESLKQNLVLNGLVTNEDEEHLEPEYSLEPGWDDDEASHLQHTAGDE